MLRTVFFSTANYPKERCIGPPNIGTLSFPLYPAYTLDSNSSNIFFGNLAKVYGDFELAQTKNNFIDQGILN